MRLSVGDCRLEYCYTELKIVGKMGSVLEERSWMVRNAIETTMRMIRA